MKTHELIQKLLQLPQDAEVSIVYDGADRMDVDHIWLSQKGSILLSGSNNPIYETEDRPEGVPSDRFYSTSDLPSEEIVLNTQLKPGDPGCEWAPCSQCGRRSVRCGGD